MLKKLAGLWRSGAKDDAAPSPRQRAEALKQEGNAALARGDLAAAERSYRAAIEADPGYAEAYNNLGIVLGRLASPAQARACLEQAIRIDPGIANAHFNLAMLLRDLGDAGAARSVLERAVERLPQAASLHFLLGESFREGAQPEAAAACYRRALAVQPDDATALYHLAMVLRAAGEAAEAERCYRRVLALQPENAGAHYNLANLLEAGKRYDEAVAGYRRAVELRPDFADAHYNLGNALFAQGRLDEAAGSYRRAIACRPDFAAAHYNLANALQPQGLQKEAIAGYREALRLQPDLFLAHCNLIFTLDLSDDADTALLQAERRRCDDRHLAPLCQSREHANDRSPERRLRVGYVSADFRSHSAVYVFRAMLALFDAEGFEVYAYSNATAEDATTRLIRDGVDVWRNIAGLADDDAAALVRRDAIDILVDLSGHSAGNRLPLFARKPAPVQVTGWGYATSTGMQAMDAFFADAVVVPPAERALYVEPIRYLPSVVCYLGIEPFPDLAPPPCLATGRITFGSFNRLAKVTPATLATWARVLEAVPDSRLLLKTPELEEAAARQRLTAAFTAAGVAAERIVMLGKSPWRDHVAAYGQVDIALDPFPHGGGVTTLEGLMMGVPALTLMRPTVVGRLSASMLTTMGLTEWIAETPEQYVALAATHAARTQELARLRGELRERFNASALGDAATYVKAVEGEYRELWRQWCRGGKV